MITKQATLSEIRALYALGLKTPPRADTSAFTAEVWIKLLPDWTDQDLALAIVAHLRDPDTGAWWPTPSDLIRQHKALTPSLIPPWEEAWTALIEQCGRLRVKRLEDVVMPDAAYSPASAGIEALGGWKHATEASDFGQTDRAAFREAYQAKAKRIEGTAKLLSTKQAAGLVVKATP